jgi:hypothetical protein
VLDLDDVGTPVGEDCPRGRRERELCHFEDAHALHNLRHDKPNPMIASPSRPKTPSCAQSAVRSTVQAIAVTIMLQVAVLTFALAKNPIDARAKITNQG